MSHAWSFFNHWVCSPWLVCLSMQLLLKTADALIKWTFEDTPFTFSGVDDLWKAFKMVVLDPADILLQDPEMIKDFLNCKTDAEVADRWLKIPLEPRMVRLAYI